MKCCGRCCRSEARLVLVEMTTCRHYDRRRQARRLYFWPRKSFRASVVDASETAAAAVAVVVVADESETVASVAVAADAVVDACETVAAAEEGGIVAVVVAEDETVGDFEVEGAICNRESDRCLCADPFSPLVVAVGCTFCQP